MSNCPHTQIDEVIRFIREHNPRYRGYVSNQKLCAASIRRMDSKGAGASILRLIPQSIEKPVKHQCKDPSGAKRFSDVTDCKRSSLSFEEILIAAYQIGHNIDADVSHCTKIHMSHPIKIAASSIE